MTYIRRGMVEFRNPALKEMIKIKLNLLMQDFSCNVYSFELAWTV
jgi:hypothetical protein